MKTFNDNTRLVDFDAWSGAVETKNAIMDADKEDEFDSLIEDCYPDGLSETALNDILWFEENWIFESLGMKEEEEEEDERDEEFLEDEDEDELDD